MNMKSTTAVPGWLTPGFSKALRSKVVVLPPGGVTPEHITVQREELLVVLDGEAEIVVEGESCKLCAGETMFIAEGKKHSVRNRGTAELRYLYAVAIWL